MLSNIWLIHPEKQMCDAFSTRFAGLPGVTVLQKRFEELPPHDCFVTAANSYGMMTAGIDAVLVEFFGEMLMKRVHHHIMDQYLGEQPVGTAFVISTGHQDFPFIAHSPTMRVPGSIRGTENVYTATWAALLAIHRHNLSEERKITTAAFPAMGTGFGDVPFDEAARQMAAAYRLYLEPPHRIDWDTVTDRHRVICYDGAEKVL
jgi:O-acetyl-ADP-ribose deacetylase (regulator of RNase III)